MTKAFANIVLTAAGVAAVTLLSGCAESRIKDPFASTLRIDPDFGTAIRTDLAAQVANPDPHYAGAPAPGSDGERAGLAQQRYAADRVIQPASTNTSSISGGGGGGGGGESGGGAGAPSTP